MIFILIWEKTQTKTWYDTIKLYVPNNLRINYYKPMESSQGLQYFRPDTFVLAET